MIPRRPSRIFRSRWAALFWAAGVLFTAVTFIGFGDSEGKKVESALVDATGADFSNADLAVLENMLN
jgi:hypothetical protein